MPHRLDQRLLKQVNRAEFVFLGELIKPRQVIIKDRLSTIQHWRDILLALASVLNAKVNQAAAVTGFVAYALHFNLSLFIRHAFTDQAPFPVSRIERRADPGLFQDVANAWKDPFAPPVAVLCIVELGPVTNGLHRGLNDAHWPSIRSRPSSFTRWHRSQLMH